MIASGDISPSVRISLGESSFDGEWLPLVFLLAIGITASSLLTLRALLSKLRMVLTRGSCELPDAFFVVSSDELPVFSESASVNGSSTFSFSGEWSSEGGVYSPVEVS